MGRQVRFYTIGGDTHVLLSALRAVDPTLICFEARRPRGSLGVVVCNPETCERFEVAFVAKSRLGDLVWTAAGSVEILDYELSPAIEWSRSYIRDGALFKGRLFMTTGYFADEGRTTKDASFVHDANRMFKSIKQKFQRFDDFDGYFGPEARSWVLSIDRPREFSYAIVPASQTQTFEAAHRSRVAEFLTRFALDDGVESAR